MQLHKIEYNDIIYSPLNIELYIYHELYERSKDIDDITNR